MISFSRDQLFLVTGASSGLGKAVAHLLLQLGASVVGVGRDRERLKLARDTSSSPSDFYVYSRDLSQDLEGILPWVKVLCKEHGKFSGLFSAAGLFLEDGLLSYDAETTNRHFLLSFQVPILLTRALVDRRHCIGAGASFVYASSASGVSPLVGLLTYGSIKAALIHASKVLSKELGTRRIRFNTVSPGLVETPLLTAEEVCLDIESTRKQYPLGLGQPEDVAHAVVFLLSSQAGWITGQNIVLDGGSM